MKAFFSSARLASALATIAIGLGILAWPLHNVIGWAGLFGMIVALLALCAGSTIARRESIDLTGLLPISLLTFVAWTTLSLLWSQYQWVTLGGLIYFYAFTLLGLYIVAMRDSIQIIRAFGDVVRFVLVGSLVLEVISGLLIDAPIAFLDIGAHLAQGGPISGLLGNRNELGLLAVIGAASFVIEWRTKTIQPGLAIGSLIVAVTTLVFSQSAVAFGAAIVSTIVLGVLYLLRRIPAAQRQFWQFAVLALAVIAAITVWVLRSPIVALLNASGDLNHRLNLWQKVWAALPAHGVEGWGWVGQWNSDVSPFSEFAVGRHSSVSSALNAYLDVWFQLGIIGIVLFMVLVGLAFSRSWLLASRKRSVIYTWPAVVLAALITGSLAESGFIVEWGWLIFVICCVNASQNLSWRTALRRPLEPEPLES